MAFLTDLQYPGLRWFTKEAFATAMCESRPNMSRADTREIWQGTCDVMCQFAPRGIKIEGGEILEILCPFGRRAFPCLTDLPPEG